MRLGFSARVALLAGVVGVFAMALSACSSSTAAAQPEHQDAGADTSACTGVLDEAGVCGPKCDDSLCNPGNYCVNNACQLACTSHLDCPAGWQCFGGNKKDSDGSDVSLCEPAKAPIGEGEYLWPCPKGDECKQDPSWMCNGLVGDPDAYCTKFDCATDADCAGGMWCGIMRDFHTVCGQEATYPSIGDPDPGACIDPADFTKDGKTYRLGPATLIRNVCLKRGYCAECESDLDCSLTPGNLCVKTAANSKGYCSKGCAPDKGGCPWEGASTCAEAVPSKGATCNPTYGACVGNKDVCTPCRNDMDCWDPSSPGRKMCLRAMNSLEPYCVDLDTACASDTDCPVVQPGNVRMKCIVDPAYVGSIIYQRCYPRDNGTLVSGHTSCYHAPPVYQ